MPRTKKDFEDRKQQIIDAALEVFASKGFEKATNREIAKAAGIGSPGLIYHYFKDKWDLFQQVIVERAPIGQLLRQQTKMMDQSPDEVLTTIATTMLNAIADPKSATLARLMIAEGIRRPQLAEMAYNTLSGRLVKLVETYLAHQMALGTLRPMDPQAAARCFLGPLVAYIFTHDLLRFADVQHLDRETMIAATVDVFLRGMETHREIRA